MINLKIEYEYLIEGEWIQGRYVKELSRDQYIINKANNRVYIATCIYKGTIYEAPVRPSNVYIDLGY